MNNNTQESKVQLEYINKCTEIVKEKYEKEPAFFIQNAGCQMNSLQTETVAGIVKRMGYKEVFKEEEADVVENAVKQVLKDGYRTIDIMADGKTCVGTTEMGDLIAERI